MDAFRLGRRVGTLYYKGENKAIAHFLFLSSHFLLKNGNVSVESKKPIDGTMALSQGVGTAITHMYKPMAKYVNTINNPRRA